MIIRTETRSRPHSSAGSGARRPPVSQGGVVGIDRSALADERDFLLRSLRDLEVEHQAGDIDDADFHSLWDDYTARAAGVLRMLADTAPGAHDGACGDHGASSAHPAPVPEAASRRRSRWRTSAIASALVLVGVLAAWAVTAASGSRLDNAPITGTLAAPKPANPSPGQSGGPVAGPDPRLLQAGQLVQKGDVAGALKLYDSVLRNRPNDPAALASEGWLIAQAGMSAGRTDLIDQGLFKVEAAEKADPTYPTAHFFRGALLLQAKADPGGAVTELREYLGMVDPSSPEVPQVEQLLRTAIAAAGPAVSPGPNAPTTTVP
jgi:hypothetical protein